MFFIFFVTIKIFFLQIQKIRLVCKGSFQLPGLWTDVDGHVDVDEEGQILARTQVNNRFHIRVLDKLVSEISREIPSKCNHYTFADLIARPTDAGFVLESCCLCEVIRNYNVRTGQCSVAYHGYTYDGISHGPTGSILTFHSLFSPRCATVNSFTW